MSVKLWQDSVIGEQIHASRAEVRAISSWWRVYFENPEKYKDSELERIILDWLRNGDGKEIVEAYEEDEWI